MPQMMPMNWFFLMIYFMFIYLLINLMIFNLLKFLFNKEDLMKKKMTKNIKWM